MVTCASFEKLPVLRIHPTCLYKGEVLQHNRVECFPLGESQAAFPLNIPHWGGCTIHIVEIGISG